MCKLTTFFGTRLPLALWRIVREYRPRRKKTILTTYTRLHNYSTTFGAKCHACGEPSFFIRPIITLPSESPAALCLLCCPWHSRKSRAKRIAWMQRWQSCVETFGPNFRLLPDYGHAFSTEIYIDDELYQRDVDEFNLYLNPASPYQNHVNWVRAKRHNPWHPDRDPFEMLELCTHAQRL